MYIISMENSDSDIYSRLRYWLSEHANKWIIKDLCTKKRLIYCIFSIKNATNISNYIPSISTYCFSGSDGKCVETSKLGKNILIRKTVNTNEKFIKFLREYFFDNTILDGYFNNPDIKNSNTNFKNNKHVNQLFENIELKYYTKKIILELLNDQSYLKDQICSFCNKKFKTKANCNRHQKLFCKKKDELNENDGNDGNEGNDENTETTKNNNIKVVLNEINSMKNDIKEIIHNLHSSNSSNVVNNNNINSNNVSNSNVINNTINIQLNNLLSKKDKLNYHLNKVLDIDTFTENYKNNSKYHLTKDEAKVLLENSENSGINGYCEGLSTYLRKKYCLQLEDLTGDIQKYSECVLPFISNDCNLRSHYEKSNDGWVLVKSTDKIRKLLNISDQQIFNHHNKFIYYPKRGKKIGVNILLRKSDYLTIEKMLENDQKQKASNSKKSSIKMSKTKKT